LPFKVPGFEPSYL